MRTIAWLPRWPALEAATTQPMSTRQRYLGGLGFRVWGLGFRVWGLGFRTLLGGIPSRDSILLGGNKKGYPDFGKYPVGVLQLPQE